MKNEFSKFRKLNRINKREYNTSIIKVRSTKPFYRENKNREVTSIYDSDRKIDHKTDKYLREIITVTANARNAGL